MAVSRALFVWVCSSVCLGVLALSYVPYSLPLALHSLSNSLSGGSFLGGSALEPPPLALAGSSALGIPAVVSGSPLRTRSFCSSSSICLSAKSSTSISPLSYCLCSSACSSSMRLTSLSMPFVCDLLVLGCSTSSDKPLIRSSISSCFLMSRPYSGSFIISAGLF